MMGSRMNIIFLLILLLIPSVSAAYISMQITINSYESINMINTTNKGDEAAHQVQLVSKFLDEKYESKIKDKLEPGENILTTLTVNFSDKIPGNYPVLTTVHYEDANGYPFSALIASIVKNKLPARSRIALEAEGAEIKDKTKIKVTAKNLGDTSKDIRLFLFVSDEFIVNDGVRDIKIGPKKSKDVVFEVENLGARPESTYSFYAIVEYDEAGKHHSSIAPNTIEVLSKKTLFNPQTILIALSLIVVIILILQFRRKK